jgi:hypothetical protein
MRGAKVALNIMVCWRLAVSWLTSARSSAKPRSSMRSASSTTRKRTWSSLIWLRALQVQQAAGRGDHEVGVLQAGDLHLVRHAAHHVGDAQALAMLDQVDGVVRHLLREFARRAQDQRAGRRP